MGEFGIIRASIPGTWESMRKGGPANPPQRFESAVDTLARIGVKQTADGGFHVTPEALQRIRDDRIRRATVSRVPSTTRWVPREGGGLGVRKGAGRGDVIPMETLRRIREQSVMFQAIHAARAAQMRRMAQKWNGKRGEVGWRVVHKDHNEGNKTPPAYIRPFIEKFEAILTRPAIGDCETTGQLFSQLEEDLLTINRPVVEKLTSIFDSKRVVGFKPVDGALIWSTNKFLERWVADNPRWYGSHNPAALSDENLLEIASNVLNADMTTAEYVAVRDGVLENTFLPGRLIVGQFCNRTDVGLNGYFPSNVEMAAEIGLTFINTWNYNASFFTRGMLAEFILGITGDVHDDDVLSFSDMLREATQGVGRAWQPPIMPLPENGTITKIDLKPSNRDMMFETFLSLQVAFGAAIYRMDPSTINAKPWDGGASPALSAPSREKEISLAKEEGLQSDLGHLRDAILNPLAAGCHPDLRVLIETGDYDPQKEATVYEIRARTSMTRNEVRLEEGKLPKGFWVEDEKYDSLSDEDRDKYDSNPWNMPTDPSFSSMVNQQMQAKQQQAMMENQPGPDDGFGEPEGDDDGFGQPAPRAPFGAREGGLNGVNGDGPAMAGQGGVARPPAVGAARPPVPGAPMRKGHAGLHPGRVTVFVEEYGPRR